MATKFDAMLAKDWNLKRHTDLLDELHLVISPKLDGIRCLVDATGGYTRSKKEFPNSGIRDWLAEIGTIVARNPKILALDGELVCGGHDNSTWGRTSSAVMNKGAEVHPDLVFHVFDCITVEPQTGYSERAMLARNQVETLEKFSVKWVPHKSVTSLDEINEEWGNYVSQGYEGAMLNDGAAPYVHGRTEALLKLKLWDYAESRAIGVVQMFRNRPDGGLVEMAGAIKLENGVQLGTGFDDETRRWWWRNRHLLQSEYIIVRYKHLPPVGDGWPRHPVYVSKGVGEAA